MGLIRKSTHDVFLVARRLEQTPERLLHTEEKLIMKTRSACLAMILSWRLLNLCSFVVLISNGYGLYSLPLDLSHLR